MRRCKQVRYLLVTLDKILGALVRKADVPVSFYLLVSLIPAAHDSVGVGCCVVIDLDATEARSVRACRQPPLAGVVIQHNRRPHLAYTGLTGG